MIKLFNHFSEDNRQIRKLEKQAQQIIDLQKNYSNMTDEELSHQTVILKDKLASGSSLDDILNEAYAVVRETADRILHMQAYKVQLMGAIALHHGDIAEMKTGEGKTLTGLFPVYLNALSGHGVHVITANPYLSKRDKEINEKVFHFLGLTTGLNHKDLTFSEKRIAYNADITYTTHDELGFDYLRDNMAYNKEQIVLRELNYALIDEVDSILIDEARTPLIISIPQFLPLDEYQKPDKFAKSLIKNEDYEIDEESNNIFLTEKGNFKADEFFGVNNIYDIKNSKLYHRILQALRANYLLIKDKEYLVFPDDPEQKIKIIDKFTGRVMKGRAYSFGLHQAVEVKEGLAPSQESVTQATITYQNLFRLYKKISGMTGTAKTEEEEFLRTYNMRVIPIPTNKPLRRIDDIDEVYVNQENKYNALIKEIQRRHSTGQPILVGTISVESSELISKKLEKLGIPHNVLNAKNHEKEAEIIENAGQKNSITIATNMAGRGTDIKLGDGVDKLGGLAVLGLERHESRRIDNQLRGRSGRQGDPGYTKFYTALDDDLIVRFGGDQVASLVTKDFDETKPLKFKILAKAIEAAQKRIEGVNFDARKTTLSYDDVNHIQRTIFYDNRKDIFTAECIDELFQIIITDGVPDFLQDSMNKLTKNFQEISKHNNEIALNSMKSVMLKEADSAWVTHLTMLRQLRMGVGLRAYAQINPLTAYQQDAFEYFQAMKESINENTINSLLDVSEQLITEAENNEAEISHKEEFNLNKEREVTVA